MDLATRAEHLLLRGYNMEEKSCIRGKYFKNALGLHLSSVYHHKC